MPDLTSPLVEFVADAVGWYGALAVFLLMVLESACIPVPSEASIIYGGFLVSQGDASRSGWSPRASPATRSGRGSPTG